MRAALISLQAMRRALPGLGAYYGGRLAAPLLLLAATLCTLLASHERALAQAQTGLEQIVQAPDVNSSDPKQLQPDEPLKEKNNARDSAKGNVEVYYGDYTLFADRLVYDRHPNTLAAEGKVRMKDPD